MTKYPKGATGVMGLGAKFINFGTPFGTFGTCVVRNFKFGKLVDFGMSHLIDDKIFPLRGCGRLSATDN